MSNSTIDQANIRKSQDEKSASTSLLLEEFKRLHDLYLRQRVKRGERVNFFMGLSAAVGSGIVIAGETGIIDPYVLQWLGLISLTLLGIFGVNIHSNLIKNDINSDNYLRGIDRIKKYFVERDSDLVHYLLFPGTEKEPTVLIKFRLSSVRSIIQILTAVLFSSTAIIALSFFLWPIPFWSGVITVLVVGIITLFGLHRWAVGEFKKAAEKYKQIMVSS